MRHLVGVFVVGSALAACSDSGDKGPGTEPDIGGADSGSEADAGELVDPPGYTPGLYELRLEDISDSCFGGGFDRVLLPAGLAVPFMVDLPPVLPTEVQLGLPAPLPRAAVLLEPTTAGGFTSQPISTTIRVGDCETMGQFVLTADPVSTSTPTSLIGYAEIRVNEVIPEGPEGCPAAELPCDVRMNVSGEFLE